MSVRVCKKMFLATLQVSNGSLDRALKKGQEGSFEDGRKGKIPHNKKTEEDMAFVKQHINSFPKYQSHYARADNQNAQYLPPYLNKSIMYRLYSEECKSKEYRPVCFSIYKKVVHELNLKFKMPKKDTCNKCDHFKARIDDLEKEKNTTIELETVKQERDAHQVSAELARAKLREDAERSKGENTDLSMITFDLESTLPTPKMPTNMLYYKRQLWTYNLGIHDCSNNKGHMYVWHEAHGSRGAQEVGSCLQKHIANHPTEHKKLITWSDGCGGQNRNIKVALTLMKIVQNDTNSFDEITHKFLESGHSFLPNDSDFSDIEKQSKKHPCVYSPDEWCDVIEASRQGRKKFEVVKMTSQDFVSTKILEESITNRKKTTSGKKVAWLDIRWIKVTKDEPYNLFLKYSHKDEEEWSVLDLTKHGKGRRVNLGAAEQDLLYPGGRTITNAKKADLLSILKFIPQVYHGFYRKLCTQNDPDLPEDVDGLPNEPDFDIDIDIQ